VYRESSDIVNDDEESEQDGWLVRVCRSSPVIVDGDEAGEQDGLISEECGES
jgi:hypothetical protein